MKITMTTEHRTINPQGRPGPWGTADETARAIAQIQPPYAGWEVETRKIMIQEGTVNLADWLTCVYPACREALPCVK